MNVHIHRPGSNLIDLCGGAVAALCRQHGVARLELLGSAATGRFDLDTGDLDFLVEFKPEHSSRAFDAYFGLKEALEALFDRRIDLLTAKSLRNPYLIREIAKASQLLYAA
jgi:hypothetical protein